MKKLKQVVRVLIFGFTICLLPGCAGLIQNYRDLSRDPQIGYNFIIEAKTDKSSAYPNEPILLTYEIWTRYDTRYEGFKVEPELAGFWIEELAYPKETKKVIGKPNIVTRNGFRMVVAPVRKQILFGTEPGTMKIVPGIVKISYKKVNFFSSFFSLPIASIPYSSMEVEIPPVEVKINAYPINGKPEIFSGSYGDYSIAFRNQGQTPTGLIKVSLTITGTGNFYALEAPVLALDPDLKIADEGSHINVSAAWEHPILEGEKVFEWTLLPARTGDFHIPAITFSYFNSKSLSYENLTSNAVNFHVDKLPPNTSIPDKVDSGLVIIFDASGTMKALDYSPKSRLDIETYLGSEIVKRVKFDFLTGKIFASEVSDLFGTEMSLERQIGLIKGMQTVELDNDGTALGDALYAGMLSLNKFVKATGKKRILLLTDGQNNKGHIDPKTVADWAAKKGLVIHGIVIGNQTRVLFPIVRENETIFKIAEVGLASEKLQQITEKTGGQFFKIEKEQDCDQVISDVIAVLR